MAIDLNAETIAKVLIPKAKKLNADVQTHQDLIKISFQTSKADMNSVLSAFMESLQVIDVWGFRGV